MTEQPHFAVPRHVGWFPLLEMRYEEGRGRFLVAAQPIPMGETVCMSPPYCRAVTNTVKRMVCSHCYKVSTNRLPFHCSRCQEVSFCSAQCRDEAMEEHAPYECNAFKKMTRTRGRDKLDLDDVRVIVNMLNKRYLERKKLQSSADDAQKEEAGETTSAARIEEHTNSLPESTGENVPSNPVDVIAVKDSQTPVADASTSTLQSGSATTTNETSGEAHVDSDETQKNAEYQLEELRFEDVAVLVGEADMLPNALERKVFEDAAAFLLRIVDDPLKEGLDQDSVKGLFLKSRFNRFGKWSKKGTAMGFGVFPLVSYFNHSCIPNLRRYQGEDFGMLQVRAIRPIEAGEELCISYTDLHLTTSDRRMVLRDYFGFTCLCPRCTDTTDASDKYIMDKSCPSRFCQELLLPLKEYDCKVLHCRHCGIIGNKHRPRN